jgi:malonyl-CoA O-methyltransferase
MPVMSNTHANLVGSFDQAARRYDQHASIQEEVAKRLVRWAEPVASPEAILDLGCGTGFVAVAVRQRWPQVKITGLDLAPTMLGQMRRKLPDLTLINADATQAELTPHFDLIFSSMALHWMPRPRNILKRWQYGLRPRGTLVVALLTDGSFDEWRSLCRRLNVSDGLWPMPPTDFADGLFKKASHEDITMTYPSARHFLHSLKATGAATPRAGHRPFGYALMKHVLNQAPTPFTATFRILYLQVSSPTNI